MAAQIGDMLCPVEKWVQQAGGLKQVSDEHHMQAQHTVAHPLLCAAPEAIDHGSRLQLAVWILIDTVLGAELLLLFTWGLQENMPLQLHKIMLPLIPTCWPTKHDPVPPVCQQLREVLWCAVAHGCSCLLHRC